MLTREQYFPGQAQEEQVALFIRRHFMAFAPWLVVFCICFIILNIGLVLLWGMAPGFTTPDTNDGRIVVALAGAMGYLSLIFFFLRAWMSFYLDVTIVTERRLIDVEQEGIFHRQIAEQSLVRVQDVSARQRGFFQHLLNYGSLYIETASDQPNFELNNIPRPNDVAKTIINLHDRLLESAPRSGQVIDVEMAESMYGVKALNAPETTSTSATLAPKHPLEQLRPYFPEPGRASHASPPVTPPPRPIIAAAPPEGDLREGETIALQDK